MMTLAYFKLEIVAAIVGTVVLLQPVQSFSADVDCRLVIKNLALGESVALDQRSIDQSIQNLAALRLSLDMAKIEGKSSLEVTALLNDYRTKEHALIEYLKTSSTMTQAEFLTIIRQEILNLQRQNNVERQDDALLKREEAKLKLVQEKQMRASVFHRIEPGSFKMGGVVIGGKLKRNTQVKVNLTKPFEMMATPTTQLLYKKIVELANSYFSKKIKIAPDPSAFKGDLHPVEQVSWDDVQIWLKALNALSKKGVPELIDLIPSHKKGDVYRLPTDAEWEYVLRGRGVFNDRYHFGNNEEDLKYFAWYAENSGEGTHSVAEKKPVLVDGKLEFYDMIGNVGELTQTFWTEKPVGGTDPKEFAGQDWLRVTRGGAWTDAESDLQSAARLAYQANDRDESLGFRIVREVK